MFSALPLVFHDCAWATIAYLRYLNVTDNDGWLEIDQEKLRSRTSIVTWSVTALKMAIFIPLGHYFLTTTEGHTNGEYSNKIVAASLALFVLSVIPYLVALWFYFKIFRYARHLMALENNVLDDRQSSHRTSWSRQMARCDDADECGREETMEAVNVIVDDSSDDDLIELGESQYSKQVEDLQKQF